MIAVSNPNEKDTMTKVIVNLINKNALYHRAVSNNTKKTCKWFDYGVYLHQKVMTRQSISFTEPNDEWLKAQLSNKEYSSKSELVNDLIRQARQQQVQIDWIRTKIDVAENSGFTDDSKDQILNKSKSLLNG